VADLDPTAASTERISVVPRLEPRGLPPEHQSTQYRVTDLLGSVQLLAPALEELIEAERQGVGYPNACTGSSRSLHVDPIESTMQSQGNLWGAMVPRRIGT